MYQLDLSALMYQLDLSALMYQLWCISLGVSALIYKLETTVKLLCKLYVKIDIFYTVIDM